MLKPTIPLVCLLLTVAPSWADSYYTVRLDDPKAVYLDAFGARGDGHADDTAAIQKAIDRVQETVRQGIVFVPEGRYRLTKTIYIWPSIRVVGYGARRPVFLLALAVLLRARPRKAYRLVQSAEPTCVRT